MLLMSWPQKDARSRKNQRLVFLRIVFAFLAAIESACLALLSQDNRSILFHVIPQ
jgi:hypothetical protein